MQHKVLTKQKAKKIVLENLIFPKQKTGKNSSILKLNFIESQGSDYYFT